MGKKLRIGFNRDFYPLAQGDAKRASGIIVDIVSSVFARTEFPVEFVPCSLDNLSRHFTEGDVQAFAGIAITDVRRQQVIFSAPVIDSGGAWFRLNGAGSQPQSAATPSAGPLQSVIESRFPGIRVHGVRNYCDALEMAVTGEVDAAALNVHVGSHQAIRDFPGRFLLPAQLFLSLQLGVAFARDTDTNLIRVFNVELEKMRRGGGMDNVMRKYAVVGG